MKKLLTLLVPLIFMSGLASCDNADQSTHNQSKHIIKVGTSPGPYSELFLSAIKPILEKEGYQITVIDFTNLRQADVALNDGDIDLNVDQHTAYYQDFNKSTGANLIGITQIPTVPAGIYGGKKKSLDKVAKGDTVAIPVDPSNTARAYTLLQKAGWLTFKEGTDLTKVSASDIAGNKYNLNIIEIDSATIPRSLADVDYAIIPGSVAYAASVDINSTLLAEDILEHLILVVTIKQVNEDSPWAKAVVAAYHSEQFKQYLSAHNQHNYWFIPPALR
ncbi:MetQ/NlpA family ABC transporter substrate-binding protein [Orbus wheelerorum]|uniref:MetQ/NlpA family ABC transporter substrate-binding protein n=1 Tax=Orbus wheelerorum TaxID=3074111 RepID=UPI00370DB80C